MAVDKTVLDYFIENASKEPSRRIFVQPMGGDKDNVKYWNRSEVIIEAKRMAAYLESLNLKPKSQIAICSKNCAWWIIADISIWMAGHISVPIYPTLTSETMRYTLEHSESQLLFVGKLDEGPWKEMKKGVPAELKTVSFPMCPEGDYSIKWEDAIKFDPISEVAKPTLDDMATIIYTSGSTGMPKGVMHCFKAMTKTAEIMVEKNKVTDKDRYLSYLPVSHSMERWIGECLPAVTGHQIFYADSLSTFVEDLNRCKPTLFLSVPRLWLKFQAGIHTKMPPKKLDMLLSIPVISTIVKNKILKGLGLSNVRLAGSGSAPMPQDVLAWYRRLGLVLLEGYGMTENFNFSHMALLGKEKAGYVGNPWTPGVEQRIAEDGELQVKSFGIMMGYFKNPEETAKTITEDGWLRTGDKGSIDEMGRLKITGRTKEIFKTSKGKYIAPAPIENMLNAHPKVEMSCVSGRGYEAAHAIVLLNEGAAKVAEGSKNGIEKELHALMENEINPTLDQHERLKFLAIVKDVWLPENGFLTPTQKIKRSAIEAAYDKNNDEWYASKKKIIWYGW